MASIFVHASIGILGYLVPGLYPLPLLVSSLIPDIEYLPIAVLGFIRTGHMNRTVDITAKTGIFHSLLMNLLMLPALFFLFSLNQEYSNPGMLFASVLIGISSHLMLDLPAHPRLMIYWPFKVYERNPMLLRFRVPFLKKIYPYRLFETRPFQYLSEFHWTILTLIIPLVLIFWYFMIR